jgi:hypothetical protein
VDTMARYAARLVEAAAEQATPLPV